jgi:hypothetical protein
VSCCVPQEKRCDYEGFAALPTPAGGGKLVSLKHLDEFCLVSEWFETDYLFKKFYGVRTELLRFFYFSLPDFPVAMLNAKPPGQKLVRT